MKSLEAQKNQNCRYYWAVVSVVALSCGSRVLAQSTNAGAVDSSTNSVAATGGSTNVTELGNYTVIGKLNQGRDQIIPNLGATAHSFSAEQIQSISQGANAPFSEIILRAPGVAQDSAANGDLHVRGEHANLQYRINDVLLPEGITGFGLELDPRFVESMQLITGSLPAAYGFRTAGVVDITTKTGAFENGGDFEMYGGSYDTIRPSFEYGGSKGKWSYFVNGSYDHNALGIENPTSSPTAIHDITDQEKMFGYASYVIDDTSRVTFMGSGSYANYEVPNTAGLQNDPANYSAPGGLTWNNFASSGLPGTFDSSALNEQQREQNYYAVVTYQKSVGDFNGQVSVFGRGSGVRFRPDQIGDLFFNGVASGVERKLYSAGLQADGSYDLGDKHTIRGGIMVLNESESVDSATTVLPMDSTDPTSFNPAPGGTPETFLENDRLRALFSGIYLQDEWKLFPKLTLNYGARFDDFESSFDHEYQLSPRVNAIYTPFESTTLHAGYARYFTPPPLENVSPGSVDQFDGTSNESPGGPNAVNDPVKAERANYYDVGINQKLAPGLQVGVDGYYKQARNQLDDGLFGQSLILAAFNYAHGKVYGVETTASYNHGGFGAYANVAWSTAEGENWTSSQFLFNASDLAYVQNHWIYLDHDQRVTGSFGVSYTFKEGERNATRVYADALYGSGLRTTVANPNDGSVPAYYSINIGAEQSYKLDNKQMLKARLDIVNLTDNSYQLRDGSGIGVNAAQYGARIGFFGSLSYVF